MGARAWEWQYLGLCDVTVVWFETYWDRNIGPTTRFEFGYYFQEFLKNTRRRSFVVGGPEDAESVKWAQRLTAVNGLPWLVNLEHVAEAIARCLLRKP